MRNKTDFVKGALIGGILGGVSALLLARKPGSELRGDFVNEYNTISEKANRLIHPFTHDDEDEGNFLSNHSSLILGAVAGAIFGVIASLLLAPKSGPQLRETFGDAYDDIREKVECFANNVDDKRHDVMDKVDEWKETLLSILDKASQVSKKGKKREQHSTLDKILDWANLGLNVVQKLQSSRR